MREGWDGEGEKGGTGGRRRRDKVGRGRGGMGGRERAVERGENGGKEEVFGEEGGKKEREQEGSDERWGEGEEEGINGEDKRSPTLVLILVCLFFPDSFLVLLVSMCL